MKRSTIFMLLGGAVVVIAAVVGLVFYATSGMTRTADDFFAKAHTGDTNGAYALTSAELHNTASPKKLASFIQANRFDKVAKTSWSNRSIKNNTGTLDGSVTLDDGGVIPLHMQLVSENGGWKISLLELSEAGVSGGAGPDMDSSATVPPDGVVLNQVRFHTGVFFDSAKQNDISYFKQFWADGITDSELEGLIKPIQGLETVADALRDATPVVETTAPLAGGGFEASGYIEAGSQRYDYRYQFIPDGKQWKLADFYYKLRKMKPT